MPELYFHVRNVNNIKFYTLPVGLYFPSCVSIIGPLRKLGLPKTMAPKAFLCWPPSNKVRNNSLVY